MEHVKSLGSSVIQSALHGLNCTASCQVAQHALAPSEAVSRGFHVYGALWGPGKIQFFVDDPSRPFATFTPGSLPGGSWNFEHPFYILINLAVGGTWPGPPNTATHFPADMIVDYVRVYRAVPSSINPAKAPSSPRGVEVTVPSRQPWTDTGIGIGAGDSVSIGATGMIQVTTDGHVPPQPPSGTKPSCDIVSPGVSVPFVAPSLPCWSLIGRIGEGGAIFEVGSSASFRATTSGKLHLGVNDNFFGDNSGNWTAKVTLEKTPAGAGGNPDQTGRSNRPITVAVPGSRPWTATGIFLQAGDSATIYASGGVSFSLGAKPEPPEGVPPDCLTVANGPYGWRRSPFLANQLPCYSLVARVGEKGNILYVGKAMTVRAAAPMQLYLGVNDNSFGDNSGSWAASITVQRGPNSTSQKQSGAAPPKYPIGVSPGKEESPQLSGPIGSDALWNPPDDTWIKLQKQCPAERSATCFETFMRQMRASPEAIAITRTLGGEAFLSSLRKMGRVDLGTITYPFRANSNDEPELVNGTPRLINVAESTRKVSIHGDPLFTLISRQYPNAMGGWEPEFYDMENLPSGGQRFIFISPIRDGCHACAVVGKTWISFDFDSNGVFGGAKLIAVTGPDATQPPAQARRQ